MPQVIGSFFGFVIGAGENFNILEYTDSEMDSSTSVHQEKTLGDQHDVGGHQSTVHASAPSSSSPLPESSLISSSGLSMSCPSVAPSATVLATAGFQETSSLPSKSFSSGDVSVAKCSGEEAVKSDGGRTSELCSKSVPTTGFMTTDFQAKFLEFSQRKAACVTVVQTAPTEDTDTAVSAGSAKARKPDVLVAPSALKKSSPIADDTVESSAEAKSTDVHAFSGENQPELLATSLQMQVDGCCDSSEDSDDELDVMSDVDFYVLGRTGDVAAEYVEFMSVEEPELVEIWHSAVGLQVDGAADEETGEAGESREKSTTESVGHDMADQPHQLPGGSEPETTLDAGAGTSEAQVEADISSCEVVDSSSYASAAACGAAGEPLPSNAAKPVDSTQEVSFPPGFFCAANSNAESVTAASQLPSDSNLPKSTAKLQPGISAVSNVVVETTLPVLTVACTVSEMPMVTTVASSAFATSLAAEVPISSTSGAATDSVPIQPEQTLLNPNDSDIVNQPLMTTAASAPSLPPSTISAESCPVAASSFEEAVFVSVQSGALSHCPVPADAVSTISQVDESHSVSVADPVSIPSVPTSAVTGAAVATVGATSFADGSTNNAAANQPFNGAFQLRPELQHANMQHQQQPFMGHPPRRMYLPPDFHMQHRMMQRGMPASEGMMIPAEQLPHGPPPPYQNKQFAGPQTFWVRQQHPSSEWIRHPGDFGHRPVPPSHEWSRPQMMPAEWSGRQRMQQEWVYFQQQPHHPSQPPHQWVRPPYTNVPGFQLAGAEVAPMQPDAYNSGYLPATRSPANSSVQDVQVAQGIKSPGSATPRPPSHPSESPVPASPASARADMASPQSRSHTPRSMSRSSTPQAGTSGMSHTPDHFATAASPHPVTPSIAAPTMPTSTTAEQSSTSAEHAGTSSEEAVRTAVGDASSVPASVSAAEPGPGQPSSTPVSVTHSDSTMVMVASTQQAAFPPHTENVMYMHRPPHAMPLSSEMRYMGPPPGSRYIAPPPQGMYVPRAGPGSGAMTFYRMPASTVSSHSAIGALLNQQRPPPPPVGMSVHYPSVSQPPGAPAMVSRYQLIHTQDPYQPHSQRHVYSSAVTVSGPSSSGPGSFVLQHQQRGPPPAMSADAATHQEIANQGAVLPNSMQAPPVLRGPFRMPQQLGPGPIPVGMHVAGTTPPVAYGPQRPLPPSQVRMIATGEMRPQMIHIPRSSVAEFAGQAYRPRPPGEQPLLLEDLLEQVG